MTATSSSCFSNTRRVWNPSTDGLPVPLTNEKKCAQYWGLRSDHLMPDWMLRLRRMVARKIPHVSNIDQDLRVLSLASMRVHGVASEQRPGRTVIGMDINGACSYAIAHESIADPTRIVHRPGAACHPGDPEWSGFYLIEASASKFSCTPPIPVRSAQGFFVSTQASYPFSLWIHSSEWSIWNTLFDCTITEGFEGPAVAHPLANVARALYLQKCSWNDRDAKALLSSMHSCMGSKWTANDQSATKAIWSLHHMPLGWVRGEWLRQWHRTMQAYPDAILCYANIDSMHWSIDAKKYSEMPLKSQPNWGNWRTLFQGDKGVWLATGKYWIACNKRLVYHQNAGSPMPWQTKVRHSVDTNKHPGYRPWYSACVWHGLGTATKLIRKEKALVQHILPAFKSAQSENELTALQLRSVVRDRQWKKKLWFLLKRDCNEKTKNT